MIPFDVVLVPFPFSDLKTLKKRPALVLSSFEQKRLGEFLIIAMMTSNVAGLHFPSDIELTDWAGAGLPKPTTIRLTKMVTVEAGNIQKKIGSLRPEDQKKVKQQLKAIFSQIL